MSETKPIESFTGEAERIKQRRGRVFSLPDEPNVARVWLPTFNSPGLAMARSFGDFCLKNYGIISMPDVSYHCITEKDEFVVLATDGVRTNLHKHIDFCIFIELDIVKSSEDFCYIIVWVSSLNVGMGCTFQ